MTLLRGEEAALRVVLPQHDPQLLRIIEDVFVVGLRREFRVQEPFGNKSVSRRRLADQHAKRRTLL